jgi:P27 family predicted phage terminase small subunit
MRGRKPKPTARQIAEGDPRKKGKRKLEEKLAAEPTTVRGLPSCPSHLKGRARSAWDSWVEELGVMDLDHRPDAAMLEGACVNYARAVDADLILERDGLTVEESVIDKDSGEKIVLKIKRHPADLISATAWRQVRAFCSEFGFSPVSRTRLAVDKRPKQDEDLAAILNAERPRRDTSSTVQ